MKQYKFALPEGEYKAKVWSPGYIVNEVQFKVFKDSVTDVHVNMAISNGRKDFETSYKDYRMNFHKSLSVPGGITLGLALTTGTLMARGYALKNKIQSDIISYHKAASYIDAKNYRDLIDSNNKKYNRTRFCYYSFLGLTAASLGTTIFTYTRFKRNNPEPTYKPESPFKNKSSLIITPFGFRWVINIG